MEVRSWELEAGSWWVSKRAALCVVAGTRRSSRKRDNRELRARNTNFPTSKFQLPNYQLPTSPPARIGPAATYDPREARSSAVDVPRL
ncbi:hypothetical protein DB347_08835 [Opitutaceae bacterium EW11]|nr:hypothetical protein DB347_08835 [Opitutaceae bacterium EW11]